MSKNAYHSPSFFQEKIRLFHSVHATHLLNGGRISPAAFKPAPDDEYLSVNCPDMESVRVIIAYYHENWVELGQPADRIIYAEHTVREYNKAAKRAKMRLERNRNTNTWEYDNEGSNAPAYRHRPVAPYTSNFGNKIPSYSHCGIEYLRHELEWRTVNVISKHLAKKKAHVAHLDNR